MAALLGKAGVINDPGPDGPMPFDDGQYLLAHACQQDLIRPLGLSHEMMQGLVGRLGAVGSEPRRHGLNALAFTRQEEPGTVGLHRGNPIGMAEPFCKGINISGKPRLARL
jgi:hypothetical protein